MPILPLRRGSLILFGGILLLPGICSAQGTTSVTTVPDIVVSATRTAQTADETLASISIITRKDMERLQVRSVRDALRGLPGVIVVNNGGPGKATSVLLRGAESDHILVLIDGIKVGSATLGSFSFQDIPIEQIDRIELVRGPRASLYGSEAIGGVIQLFTRKGSGEIKPFARVTAGSHHTFESSAGLSGGVGRAWFNASGTVSTTRGINACSGSLVGGCFVIEPDRDGFRNRSLSIHGGYHISDTANVEVHALTTSATNEFDGSAFSGNQADVRKRVLGGKLTFAPLQAWQVTLRGGRSSDESDSFKDGAFVSAFVTDRDSFTLQNDVEFGDGHLVTGGFDYQRDGITSSTAYPVRSRWNKAGFLQYLGAYGAHDVELAYRHDRNEQFGTANTGSAAWGWKLREAVRAVVSYGTAFKAPTFNELFFPNFGDPTLDPERSRSAELALKGSMANTRWSVSVFRSEVRNLIGFDPATFLAVNVGKATIRGIEVKITKRILDFDVAASLTLLEPRNRSAGANFDNILPRRARRIARLEVDRQMGAFSFGTTINTEGERFDNLANTRRLGGFTVVDLRTQYQLAKAWSVQGRIENALDKSYATAAFFNQPGRGAFVTLRYQP
jgi:vitamin B12 transporter